MSPKVNRKLRVMVPAVVLGLAFGIIMMVVFGVDVIKPEDKVDLLSALAARPKVASVTITFTFRLH